MEVLKKGVETKMDGLKKVVEAKMNGLEAKMEGMEVGMEAKIDEKMENIKVDIEGLENLIQEMFPNGKKIVEKTHDEKKINVNRDFINSNFGWKNHHISNIDMRNFDDKDLVIWIL